MRSREHPGRDAIVTPERRPFGIAVIGGPTTVIDIAGARLGPPARPLPPWGTWASAGGLAITAVPARHGPADGELNEEGFVNCEVIGFLLDAVGAPRVYVSGDNASLEIVQQVREQDA